ncbi:putative 2-hydroxyacid dehydrogenase UNK4.10 [Favolaschia claudopus]|uniref:2-hydroxyacid dehydrogenase UNK4.10 n=1 Tax=Favolaschia claudopus TaxID=2862362 RepID=A0AAW0E144_9AGAR
MVLRVVFKVLLAFYLVSAVLYTTDYFLFSPLRLFLVGHVPQPLAFWSTTPFNSFFAKRVSTSQETVPDLVLGGSSEDAVHWSSSPFTLKNGLGHDKPVIMSEDLYFSKAFSASMGASKIVPFFYRATGTFSKEDITITTLVTSNRFQVFARLVERYPGPISVTIHVKNGTENVHELLDSLHMLYLSSSKMFSNVDIHLVIDAFDRQFNTWRNIARFFARTDFVMMLDIDFSPCTDFRTAILNSKVVMDKLRTGLAALVIPAFEYPKHEDGIDESRFPRSKSALVSLVRAGKIAMFHASWGPGHSSTDYNRYYAASPGEVYKVTSYQSAYEPYVVFKKDGPPWCDERFIGYGGNKAACLFEMYLSGISYYVLADHFLIHQNHLYEETARRIYSDFREEACLRYLTLFRNNGMLNDTRGSNAREECQKIRSIARIATELYLGHIVWADEDVKQLLGPIADVIHFDTPTRADFLAAFQPNGKYHDVEIVDGFSSSVKWIAHNGAGYDQIDVLACKAKGITVSNTPGAVDDASATTALYLLISTVRQFSISERSLRQGKFKPSGLAPKAHDLTGRTLAILGLGGIGMRLAELAHAFPMRIIYHSRHKVANAPEWCEYFANVDDMLAQADVLSVHVPLREETIGLVGENMIRKLKKGSIIINTARGKVIDEEAMIRALEDGHLASVGLDVFPNEPEVNPRLLDFPNITLLPHMGTENQDSQRKMEVRALTNLKDFLTTGKGKDVVTEMK